MASHDRPTGEVAFLFTDIEGSTALVDRLGTAAWSPLLARHRAIVREGLAAHGGHEVATEGDSFFAVFADPAAALLAAARIQRDLYAEPWPDGAAVRVRMGVHVGAGELDVDGSYVGHDVHRAARVAAAAHGGQVLLSEAAVARSGARPLPGLSFRPLGQHRLKDLRPEQIVQLDVDGVPADFPPIRSLDARPNNLPTQLTSFVGREREIAEASALLEGARLLTLTGPGGTGKSRLGLQIAAGVAERFPDGVWFVPLAALRDPQLLLPSIAGAVGAPDRPDRSPLEVVVGALAGRRALLVLDNFEQLLSGAALVADLLRDLPLLHVLATSQAPLRISGEQEYPVSGLPVPTALERIGPLERETLPASLRRRDPEALLAYEAIRLFVARGAAVRPGFTLTAADAGDAAAIVAHLGGVPLAIELAAARLRFLTPGQIHERLEKRLDLPGPGQQDVPERQRTLRGAIAWSHELLEPAWQRLLERMGVFVSGFDLEQAEAVCPGEADAGVDVLDGLAALVDHSLVRREDAPDGARFSLLEPIREFALERLEATGLAGTLREAHARAYLALAQRAGPELSGADQRRWLDRLELEHGNLRAALDWAEAGGEADLALSLAANTWRFWQKRGHLREARRRLDRLLAQPWAAEPTPARGDAAEAAGGVAYWQGDFRGALPFYEEALAIRRATGGPADVANALYNLSFCFTIGADFGDAGDVRAMTALEEALALYRSIGDDRGTANVLWGIGIYHYFRNEPDQAAGPFGESLALYRKVGDRTQEAWALRQLGSTVLKMGDLARARELITEALRLFDAAGDLAGVTMTLDRLASIAVTDGNIVRAARLHGLARRLEASSGADLARTVEEEFEATTETSIAARIGDPEIRRAVDDGAGMSLPEGVAYALDETMPGEAPPPEVPA